MRWRRTPSGLVWLAAAGLVVALAHGREAAGESGTVPPADAASSESAAAPDSTATPDGTAATTSPCEVPEARQFDFWVGEWDLTWGGDGAGVNVITRELDDCVVIEHFDGTPTIGLRGMSVSTYSPRDGKWRQTWVDNSGGYLDFVGAFADGRMILAREAVRDGRKIRQRMVWYNIADDSLDWNWEKSEDNGASWEVAWKIHYARRR